LETTLIYYTNNIVPKNLLHRTLTDAVHYSDINNLDLVVTSHYPLSHHPTFVKLFQELESYVSIDKYRVVEKIVNEELFPRARFFAVGNLPSLLTSLVRQLIFTLEQVKTETVILIEHDVLYPKSYFGRVIEELGKGYDLVFSKNSVMYNDGFLKLDKPFIFLSRLSGKTETLINHFSKYNPGETLEPIPSQYKDLNLHKCKIYDNCSVIDNEHPTLDIKHGLNLTASVMTKEGASQTNEFWGNKEDIKSLLEVPELQDSVEKQILGEVGLDFFIKNKIKPLIPLVNVKNLNIKSSDEEIALLKMYLECIRTPSGDKKDADMRKPEHI